ncbi:MAG: hypothetical protein IV100_33685 [Myxococcales bacterium]|nr:hypothetical protein [Myxococcales bacterium]
MVNRQPAPFVAASVALAHLLVGGCSWAQMNRAEVDGVFQRDCTTSTSAPASDLVMASISGAAALGLLVTGAVLMAEDAEYAKEKIDGSGLGVVFLSMSSLPILTGSIWGPSAAYGYTNAARCVELRERFPTCASAPECATRGLCTWDSPRCVAKTEADCAASEACIKHGRCTPRDGVCVASGDVRTGP